jgi:LmbE family N-acetylglucosaminyl deacetylase
MDLVDAYERIFADKKRILVVMSHPDDTELYAGGTIARLIADGKEVRSVKMTSGEKGSRDNHISEAELKTVREGEDRKAMEILGITDENNIYLDLGDGQIENNMVNIGLVAKQIREFKPDIVITHNPEHVIIRFAEGENWVNHRDHMNTALITTYAAYPYSRDSNFFPEQLAGENLGSHTVTEFLYIDYYDHPDMVTIDITDHLETRIKAHACHFSQYPDQTAREFADFFTTFEGTDKRYERFRYVAAD